MRSALVFRRPDDFHVHFRNGPMTRAVVPHTARQFARALVMPNTDPPNINCTTIVGNRAEILASVPDGVNLEPLMTFKITPTTTTEDIRSAKKFGAIAGKLYPDGVTTNSAGGVRDFKALYRVFEYMETEGLVLCLHGEHPDAEAMDRERRFVEETLQDIVRNFPGLLVVLEHISTKVGVDAVVAGSVTLAGTITAHHLELTHTDVFGAMLNPHLFCKPIAKWEIDKEALLVAATSGNPKFFFGSDSAPHARNKKECAEGCAGVFSAPVLLPVLAGIFEKHDALDRLEPFVSQFGAEFYRLPLNTGEITLVKEEWQVPDEYDGIVPYRAGEILPWKVVE